VRVLVVTNIYPSEAAPWRGAFVRDQVAALREEGVDVELFAFEPGRRNYRPAIAALRRRLAAERFDLVHAHYGLVGWCAWRAAARPLVVTFHGTDVRHPVAGPFSRWAARRAQLAGLASRALLQPEGERPGLRRSALASVAVLPCGVDTGRFAPQPRADARRRLGLDPDARYLLLPADPARPVKRADRARELAGRAGAELLTGGDIAAERMPDYMNAADAVLVTSDNEGFGLAALEALACDVAVLSTPVGIAPAALAGVDGCLVAPFDPGTWHGALRLIFDTPDHRVAGRRRAELFSARRMAARVALAYREVLGSA
jgi:teichuronic acid biosynthesis glycosyltransferase TuaC